MGDFEDSYEQNMMTSKLNSGFFIIKRLDEYWRDIYKCVTSGRFNDWNVVLDTIWSELGGEYKDDSPEQKAWDSLNKRLIRVNNWNNNNKGFVKMTLNDQREKARQYILLRQKEMYLRRTQNKQGKGTAYVESDDDYFDF